MKAFITPAYTFTPGAAGEGAIDLSAIPNFNIKRLVAIINQTSGALIYSTANSLLKYVNEVEGIVTLGADTSTMNAGDSLQIVYEVSDDFSTSAKQDDALTLLETISLIDFSSKEKQDIQTVSLGDPTDPSQWQNGTDGSIISLLKGIRYWAYVLDTRLQALDAKVFSEVLIYSETQLLDDAVGYVFTPPAGATKMIISNNPASSANSITWGESTFSVDANTGHNMVPTDRTPLLPAGEILVKAIDSSSMANVTVTWFGKV